MSKLKIQLKYLIKEVLLKEMDPSPGRKNWKGDKETIDQINAVMKSNSSKLGGWGGPITLTFKKSANGSIDIELYGYYDPNTKKFAKVLDPKIRVAVQLKLRYNGPKSEWKCVELFDKKNILGLHLTKNQILTSEEVISSIDGFLNQVQI